MKTRTEHDLLGEREVPADAYYGVHTLRALANHELGLLDDSKSNAIVEACKEIIDGKLNDQFIVDVIQGGAGTSTNMNANEVIANRGLELLGYEKGRYDMLHPLNHVNMSQSTNDVYPTALRLTLSEKLDGLMREMAHLRDAFARKAEEFADVIKMGRTQLQDAVPMTLGQEFGAWAIMITEDIQRVSEAQSLIREINMGATAIGTGLNAHPDYARLVTERLRQISAIPVIGAANLVEATQDAGAYVQLSGVLKRIAVKLSKICNDLRLLSSGPRTGFGEINLPPMAPGSSIMPGKVNPVIPEVVNQIAFKVIGNDLTVSLAAEAGQLELNVMEPVIVQSLFESMEMLINGMETLRSRCIVGITANEERCKELVMN